MEETKNKHGGARPGAGRKYAGRIIRVRIGKTSNDLLGYHAECVGMKKNELADALIFTELSVKNKDFVYCECGAPVLYTPIIAVGGKVYGNCKECGKEYEYEAE